MNTMKQQAWQCFLAFSFLFFWAALSKAQLHYNYQEQLSNFSFVEMPDGHYFAAGTIYNDDLNNPTDILVVYLDPSAQVLWDKRIDNGQEDRCFNINVGINDEAVLTGFMQLDQTVEMFLISIDVAGNITANHNYDLQVSNPGCATPLAHSTGMHVIANEESGQRGYTITGFGFDELPITSTTEKEIFVLRVDQDGFVVWEFHMNTPQNGALTDYDMGEHILRVPGGYYITGSSNLTSNPNGFPQQATLSLRIDDGGGFAWHNSYITAGIGQDRQPGACAVFYDNPNNPNIPDPTILTLSNSTDTHLFQVTEIDPGSGAILGPVTHDYLPNPDHGMASTMFVHDNQERLVVAGYSRSTIFQGVPTSFGNSPPFMVEIDLNNWGQFAGSEYPVPSVNGQWAATGDWFTLFAGACPWIHSPEMALPNLSGTNYSFLAYRDEFDSGEFDLEYSRVPLNLAGPCGDNPFLLLPVNVVPETNDILEPGCIFEFFTFEPNWTDPCQTTGECNSGFDWPIVDDGFTDTSEGEDVFVDEKYQYTTGFFFNYIELNGASFTGNGAQSMFASQIDDDGNVIWLTGAVPSGSDQVTGNGIVSDGRGGTYVIGDFTGTANFGPSISITSLGQRDIYVARINECGEFTWVHRYGGTGNDLGKDIAMDADGDLYVVGTTNGTLTDNAQTITSAGGNDGWVARLDQAGGNMAWLWRVGGTGNDAAEDITFDQATNSVYAVGAHNGPGTYSRQGFIPNGIPLSGTGADAWVGRWTLGGTVTWISTMGGSGIEWGAGIDVTSDGVFITGSAGSNNCNFASSVGLCAVTGWTPVIGGLTDMFVGRFLLTGCPTANFQNISGSDIDTGLSIAVDDFFNIVYAVGGTWSGTVTGLTGMNANPGTFDFMVVRAINMNAGTGAVINGEINGDTDNDLGQGVAFRDGNPGTVGHAYFTGFFSGTVNFPVTRTSLTANNTFYLSRINDAGNVFKTGEESTLGVIADDLPGITAFPNPNTGQVQVRLNFDHQLLGGIELFTMQGKRISLELPGQAEFGLDLTDQPAGVYFLRLRLRDGRKISSKLIKIE